MTVRSRSSLLIPILIGILVALLALLAVMLLTDEDPTAATTTEPVTTTAAHTTVATTTTTLAPTTTVFIGGIETVSNLELVGTPGPNLTDLRGNHDGFVRVAFDSPRRNPLHRRARARRSSPRRETPCPSRAPSS
jgi:hypothetical protein